MIKRTRAQAVIIRSGHVLMVRHHDLFIGEHYWCLPGGGVEAGEHPEQAVIRELKEETGLDVRTIGLLCIDRFPGVDQGYAAAFTYRAEVVGGKLSLGFDPEQTGWSEKFLQEVQWREIDAELLHRLQFFMGNALITGGSPLKEMAGKDATGLTNCLTGTYNKR